MQINGEWLLWASGASLALLIVGLLAAPLAIAKLPVNYFNRPHPPQVALSQRPLKEVVKIAARNVLGVVVVLAGIAMLVLPGQGLLTIVVGVLLSDFRWKRRLLARLVARRGVQRGLNLVRRGLRKEPFSFPQLREPNPCQPNKGA